MKDILADAPNIEKIVRAGLSYAPDINLLKHMPSVLTVAKQKIDCCKAEKSAREGNMLSSL